MNLTNKFHKMEMECSLFELGKNDSVPFWDILRYDIYREYYYPREDAKRFFIPPSYSIKHYLKLAWKLFPFLVQLLFRRPYAVFFTASRYRNAEGLYYDKSAVELIEALKGRGFVIESVLDKKLAYEFSYDFNNVFGRFLKAKDLPRSVFDKIEQALIRSFGECMVTYELLNAVYRQYLNDVNYYGYIFRRLKPQKVFAAIGNPKAILRASSMYNIKTYLLQHASIEFDEIDYSYPTGISNKDNIVSPDYILTFGDYWCRNLNTPAKAIIPMGNNFFGAQPSEKNDASVLIISSVVHGGELSKLTAQLAVMLPETRFKFKLHPNEYHFRQDYEALFGKYDNVEVITVEEDTSTLIARSRLIILIVSAVLYEALNQNKPVAVYKRVNYERQIALAHLPNLYFFDQAGEIINILEEPVQPVSLNFYKKTERFIFQDLVKETTIKI